MSKSVAAVLILILAVLFCACEQNTDQLSGSVSTRPTAGPTAPSVSAPTQAPTETPTESTQPWEPTQPATPTEPTVPEEPPEEEVLPMTEEKALFHASSADGYSIWHPYTGISPLRTYCVDAKGNITFEVDKNEVNVTPVYHNSVIMRVNYEYDILRSAMDGNCLFTPSEHDGAQIMMPDHAGKVMFRDGYILVVKATEGAATQIGILNPQGQWLRRLTSRNPLLAYLDAQISAEDLQARIVYMGQGILGIRCDDEVFRYYFIETEAIVKIGSVAALPKYTLHETLENKVFFTEGVSEPVYMNHNFYLFYSNGTIKTFKVLWPTGIPRANRVGEPYFDRKTQTAYFLYEYQQTIFVADHNGNVLKIHNNMDLTDSDGFSSDGYARVILRNAQGAYCYAVFGTDGEICFTPVLLGSFINGVVDPMGYRMDVGGSNGYGYCLVINVKGEILYRSGYVLNLSVNNGVIRYLDTGGYHYIKIPA